MFGRTAPLESAIEAEMIPYCIQTDPERTKNPPPESPLLGDPPSPPPQNVRCDENIARNRSVV